MAIVNGSVLGNLSGKLGNLAARTVEGRTILAARPSSFNVNYDPAVVAVRQKFAVTANLAKNINSLTTLEEIWKGSKENGISVFNTIFKQNFQYSDTDKPTVDNIITPGGFVIDVQTPAVAASGITGTITALNSASVFGADEVNLTISALVCFYNPTNTDDPAYQLIKLSQDEAGFDFTSDYTLNMTLNVLQAAIAGKYQNSILYLSVASKNADGKVIQYSATFSNNS
jgi:hypothetical protein